MGSWLARICFHGSGQHTSFKVELDLSVFFSFGGVVMWTATYSMSQSQPSDGFVNLLSSYEGDIN
jgi:hypothetical protein